jgi:hypothetical protein
LVAGAEANGLWAGDEYVAARGEEGLDGGLNSVKIEMAEGKGSEPCLSLPLPLPFTSFVGDLERLVKTRQGARDLHRPVPRARARICILPVHTHTHIPITMAWEWG